MHVGSWMCLHAVREADRSFHGVVGQDVLGAAWLAQAELSETVTPVLDQVLLTMHIRV